MKESLYVTLVITGSARPFSSSGTISSFVSTGIFQMSLGGGHKLHLYLEP